MWRRRVRGGEDTRQESCWARSEEARLARRSSVRHASRSQESECGKRGARTVHSRFWR